MTLFFFVFLLSLVQDVISDVDEMWINGWHGPLYHFCFNNMKEDSFFRFPLLSILYEGRVEKIEYYYPQVLLHPSSLYVEERRKGEIIQPAPRRCMGCGGMGK
ncbi:MAG: hypothetical protein J3R72DRAFT_428913 [Linnemannia gamsii]|nr:MAG: hypothetical protein J3R72DRAFT_428913 [Linnemannia gamsii]